MVAFFIYSENAQRNVKSIVGNSHATRKSILGIKYRLKAKTRIWGLYAFLGVYGIYGYMAIYKVRQIAQKRDFSDYANCTKGCSLGFSMPFFP